MLSVGMSLLLKCKTPVLPIDTFTRDLPENLNIPYKKAKTAFDLSCLAVTIVLSIVFLQRFEGIGIGTIVCALITGKVVSNVNSYVDKNYYFQPIFINRKDREVNNEVVSQDIN